MSYDPPATPEPPAGWNQPPQAGPPPQPPKRRRHRTRNILVSVASAFVILIVIGIVAAVATARPGVHNVAGTHNSPAATAPAAAPAAAPSSSGPAMLTVGQADDVENNGNSADTATVTITSMANSTQSSDPYGEAPQNGYFVVAQVTAASQFDGFDINETDFYVLVGGVHYDVNNGNSYFGDENATDITTTLNAGESASGQLLFDLPSTHGTLVWAPNFSGAPVAEWSF